jgi:hypothetical protein
MSKTLARERARNAFRHARLKAFVRRVLSMMRGQPNHLLAYDEVRRQVRAGLPAYRGIQSVPLRQIIGSVNRYRDFDRAFLPTQNFTSDRWRSIGTAFYDDVVLPPVKLYKVGGAYFVIDGNHRVSVARELGQEYIDAEVMECRVRVPITPDIEAHDLEVIDEKLAFLEATRLEEKRPQITFDLTIPGGYHLLLEHVEVHRYLQSTEWNREFSTEEAAAQWADQVYLPLVEVIRASGIVEDFPGRTETDLYLWIIEHHYYLRERYGDRVSPWDAARSFSEHFTSRPLHRLWHYLVVHVLKLHRSEE